MTGGGRRQAVAATDEPSMIQDPRIDIDLCFLGSTASSPSPALRCHPPPLRGRAVPSPAGVLRCDRAKNCTRSPCCQISGKTPSKSRGRILLSKICRAIAFRSRLQQSAFLLRFATLHADLDENIDQIRLNMCSRGKKTWLKRNVKKTSEKMNIENNT